MKTRFFTVIAASVALLVSCTATVKSSDLKIAVDNSAANIETALASTPLFASNDNFVSLTVDGKQVEFKTTKVETAAVSDEFGTGKQTVVTAQSPLGIERKLILGSYEQFPSTVIVKAVYTNKSEAAASVDAWTMCNVNVAAAGQDPAFWTFQGQSTEGRDNWLIPIQEPFFQKNFMGMNNSDYGGGIPVTCVWRRDAGVIIGHLAPNPELVSLPVEKKEGEPFVNAVVLKEFEEPVVIDKDGTLETLTCFVSTYNGDCFGALRNYSQLLEKVGVVMPESEPEAFETAWCAWGYERRFTIDEIIGTLPKVKELGFKWATLDDGYQIAEGDWDLTKERFPHGDADMKYMVDKFHEYGLKAELWWAPLAADPGTEFLEKYPDSIIKDPDGKPHHISWWNSYYLSPVDEDVVREQGKLVEKFIKEYGFDGLKLDGQHMNSVAPDYSPAHHPEDPEKDVRELPSFFKMIFNTARGIKEHAVIQYCPCGDCFSVYNLPYTNKTVSSDPESSYQIRTKGYVLRAIAPKTAYYGDHIELSDGENDFPTQLGIGAVIGTKFTWPKDNPYVRHSYLLTPEREVLLKNALAIYEEKKLSTGELLGGLYDIGFDYPETYVIKQNGNMYYAFYATGEPVESVVLRGLEPGKTYSVNDYYNHVDLGTVVASDETVLQVPVEKYLLIEVIEN